MSKLALGPQRADMAGLALRGDGWKKSFNEPLKGIAPWATARLVRPGLFGPNIPTIACSLSPLPGATDILNDHADRTGVMRKASRRGQR